MKRLSSLLFVALVGCFMWCAGNSYATFTDNFNTSNYSDNANLEGQNSGQWWTNIYGGASVKTTSAANNYPSENSLGVEVNLWDVSGGYFEALQNNFVGNGEELTFDMKMSGVTTNADIYISLFYLDEFESPHYMIGMQFSWSESSYSLYWEDGPLVETGIQLNTWNHFGIGVNADSFYLIKSDGTHSDTVARTNFSAIAGIEFGADGKSGTHETMSFDKINVSSPSSLTPEPSSLLFMLMGLGGLLTKRMRQVVPFY